MGFSISWLAVKGKAPEALARELGLIPTGEMVEHGASMFTARSLQGGWFLVVINRCEHKAVGSKSLASLSLNCEAVACSVEEHVMACSSELWRNGEQVWRLEHDAQQSIDHISTAGVLPDIYFAVWKECSEQQNAAGGRNADTDYFFEIPLQTAKELVGFKHDEAELEDDSFEIYQTDRSKETRPWWKVW